MNSSLDQILKYYRQKDVIEKVYAQIKVEMYGNRFITQNDETTDGKMFTMFIAAIIRAYLVDKLSIHAKEKSLCMRMIFDNLVTL
ncbi:MAG: hypothetical protein LBF68_06910 [Christensenellaceae bacterium]|jgi:transposase|nr:hypothetical protein [Christensenellaceae bacterium]